MARETEPLTLDARLLSQTVIELNIARRSVAIYPQGHPAAERSLVRAHDYLRRLFELRSEITLAVAKDALIIDEAVLDRKNPVYREFALHLNRLGIASLSFRAGLSQQELKGFCRVLVGGAAVPPGPEVGRLLEKEGVGHILLRFIDYGDFAFREGEARPGEDGQGIWERYIRGLIDKTLESSEPAPGMRDLPPRVLARFLNERPPESLREVSYDRVISSYVRGSSERPFSGQDFAKLLDFVDAVRPELKRQFLSSTVNFVSSDLAAAKRALRGMKAERIVGMLSAINEQQLLIPDAFRILISTLSKVPDALPEERSFAGRLLADDHVMAEDITELLGSGSFSSFVTDSYRDELLRLQQFDAASAVSEKAGDILRECGEERIEQDFTILLCELLCSEILPEQDYRFFVKLLLQEAEGHLATGRYAEVLRSIDILELNQREGRYAAATAAVLEGFHAPEFLRSLAGSLAIFGRQRGEEARSLCGRYGGELLPALVEALIAEHSLAARRYLSGLIAGHGAHATPELIAHLDDPRWFVQRNMIFLLGRCDPTGAASRIRPLCRSTNAKVSFEAIRYLLRAGDPSGVEPLLERLGDPQREMALQAVWLAGALRVRDAVPQLLRLLARKSVDNADLLERIPIVKALGEIGDERALPALRELAGSRSLLSRGALERVRDEVFLSLRRYPFTAARDLVEEGARSHAPRVSAECRRILEANRG
jgi:hypothetical protein